MDIETIEKNALYVLKGDDIDRLLKAAATQSAPAPTPTNATPIPQAQALRDWNTTRQRLARLRRLGLLEALTLNGRIFYRPEAYADAMQSLNRHKKPLA